VNLKSSDFVEEAFREYYRRNSLNNSPVHAIDRREFGFVSFEGQVVRHRNFQNKEELTAFLSDFVPRDVYSSCAYYRDPEAEMDVKGWLGADLIFDIDADHIPTSCDKVHDKWICDCSFAGRGIVPEECPSCGGQKFSVKTWSCEKCLESAKDETIKLLDILKGDFGISEKDMYVFFSGNRGYHVHVENEVTRTLDSMSRKEIVDYVCGLGLDVAFHGLRQENQNAPNVSKNAGTNDSGWRKRISEGVYNFVLNARQEDYRRVGLKGNVIKAILDNRDRILKGSKDGRFWSEAKGVGFESWKKMAEFCAVSESAKIDTVVTTDIHRLIRLADTLHGKTGLKKTEFPISQIEDFDPFKSAIAFKSGVATVLVSDVPEFRLGDESFGPFEDEKVELPMAAALLLVCKGRAEVVA
jgi:DNA primase small subunit